MTASGLELRNYYIQRRRVFNPDYRPDGRTEKMWGDIAEFAIQNNCNIRLFVDAAFSQCRAGLYPYPNMLKSTRALGWYKRHVQEDLAAQDPKLAEVAMDGTAEEVMAAEIRAAVEMYKYYVNRYTVHAVEQQAKLDATKKVLMDDEVPLAPWFRCLYSVPPDSEVHAKYFAAAREQVLRDPILKKILTEEFHVDVSSTFH